MREPLTILTGDWVAQLGTLPDASVHCCVTSPPYWGLRDYGVKGQLGLEKTPEEYVAKIVAGFREVRRVLRNDGTLWVNLGDSYFGDSPARKSSAEGFSKTWNPQDSAGNGGLRRSAAAIGELRPKNLIGIPWRVAFALQADGWWLRSDIIWHKPNPMPESVTDRPTKAHEYIFLLSKSPKYFYDAEAIKEPVTGDAHMRKANGRNSRMVLERAAGRENSKPNPSRSNIPGVTPKSQPAGSGVKANESFHAACVDLVSSRNKRTVWTVASAPYSEAHFATFPPDLIKPCILAGTSARGCCPKCGAPWERVLEISGTTTQQVAKANGYASHSGAYSGSKQNLDFKGSHWKLPPRSRQTAGWLPSCDCGDIPAIPCTVLDPFFGSGTTGMVALELGRHCIGVELNPQCVRLAQKRTTVTLGLAL